jgi:hypothetical protein
VNFDSGDIRIQVTNPVSNKKRNSITVHDLVHQELQPVATISRKRPSGEISEEEVLLNYKFGETLSVPIPNEMPQITIDRPSKRRESDIDLYENLQTYTMAPDSDISDQLSKLSGNYSLLDKRYSELFPNDVFPRRSSSVTESTNVQQNTESKPPPTLDELN